jgi:SAM-dependent methyltransferase
MTGMESEPVERCPACGSAGEELYRDLVDRHFGAPGVWGLRRCHGCLSLWLDPRPTESSLQLAYVEYYTHGETTNPPGGDTAKRFLRLLPSHRDDVPAMTAHLAAGPGRVLDLGCGDGRTAIALQSAGWNVVAMDQDPASIDAAVSAGALDARVGTIVDLPDDEAPFDAVVMSHVIEHLVDPGSALTGIRTRLRPGGRLVVLTPNAASASHQRFGPLWRGLEVPRHLQVFTADGLRRLLDDSGLTTVTLRTSARGANGVARESAVRDGGARGGRLRNLAAYAAGELWQARVDLRLRRDPWVGDELVAIARA